ncbi:MAG TPA: 30S ribosomal protein S18 [bacterium]|nr:30S ribosomal protein S18 [bacterium]
MIKTRRKRICRFCENKIDYVDYTDPKKLTKFTTDVGKIIPRRTSGTCGKHQRQLVQAIKRARHLALIPFVSDYAR